MTPPQHESDPGHAVVELDELVGVLEALSAEADALHAPLDDAAPDVDPAEMAGPSGQAQENRAIGITRARLAADRAREARVGLPELAAQARALAAQVRWDRLRQEGEIGRAHV